MGRRMTGIDTAMLVTGILMLILTISLIGVVGAILEASSDYKNITNVPNLFQLGIAGWYLLTSIFAIASGASGNKCPYIAVIVLTVLAVFIAIGGVSLAIFVLFTNVFYDDSTLISVSSPDISIEGSTLVPQMEIGLVSSRDGLGVETESSYENAVNQVLQILGGLPYGVMIINCISFILLIVISSIACCGTCCNSSRPVMEPQSTTIVTTSGGYTATAGPPGYVSQPPAGQQYVFQGMSNPNYDTSIAMNPYTTS